MGDLFCHGCGYDLTGLPENRCPECGLPFEPTVLRQEARLHELDTISGRGQMLREAQLREIVAVQFFVGIMCSLTTAHALFVDWIASMAAYWVAVLVYMLRRSSCTRSQLVLIRWAWIPIFFLTMILSAVYFRVFLD